MTTKEHRKAIPLGVKLHACLLLLGFTDEDIAGGIQWDHQPALAFREIVDGKMVPDPNDPRYIRPMKRDAHKVKTSGRPHLTAGSDVHMAFKVKRLTGETPKRKGRKLQGRGFRKAQKNPPPKGR